jgi:hypothetical protein
MSAIIEVASIRPPKQGKKVATVVDATGASFECWPEKVATLQVGKRYAVEVETREWQGRPIRKITKAEPADRRATPGNGHHPAKPTASQTTQPPSGGVSEHAFVASILTAFIAAGKVGLDADEIAAAIDTVRAGCRRARQMNGGGNAQH